MNKKGLFIAAIAGILSVTCAGATNISGVTGNNGIYNINPEHVNGTVGYRQYQNFELSKGDIANLMYQYGTRDIQSFLNLVDNQVKIDGIVNTMKGNNFYNGHAVFISPNGMVVGASGVLNVGSLSVVTPTANKYNSLKSDYAQKVYTNIDQVSKLKQDSNADISIKGKIFAREGVDLRGANIGVSGSILNGVTAQNALTSSTEADALFNSLVNTNGVVQASAFTSNGSNVIIKSGSKTDGTTLSNAGINVSGTVVNYGGGDTALTNHGGNGLTVTGKVDSNNTLSLYNTKGNLSVAGNLSNKNAALAVSNTGADLDIGNNASISSDNNVAITNKGTGHLAVAGSVVSTGATNIVNSGAGGMNITGKVGSASTSSIRIVNRGGQMVLASGSEIGAKAVRIENDSTSGMYSNGTVGAEKSVSMQNKAGSMNIDGDVVVEKGNINIVNDGTKLTLGSKADIDGNGIVSIKNNGSDGMSLSGTIANTGTTALNNTKGQMLVNGTISNEGNLGIINKGAEGLLISKNASVTNKGNTKIANTGASGLTVVGYVDNTGNLKVYNYDGTLSLANDSKNQMGAQLVNRNGNVYIESKGTSTGVKMSNLSKISNENGWIAIKNNGTSKDSTTGRGVDLQGTISNAKGDIAINNYKNDMYVSGDINAENGNIGIINRSGAGKVDFAKAGTIEENGNMNIKNYGSGDMTVADTITHNGRLNILANSNALNLAGKINNNGGYTYAASRQNGTGINATNEFVVDSTGTVLIKNISGENGLRYNGTINNKGAQTALVNKKGNMEILGDITGTNGAVIVSNFGTGLTTTTSSTISSDKEVRIVNTGSKAAVLAGKVNAPAGTKYFYEKVK